MIIKGIRLDSITITHGDETKLEGQYSLVSDKDTVIAKQGFNGYSDIKVEMSAESRSALNQLITQVKADISRVLGFNDE